MAQPVVLLGFGENDVPAEAIDRLRQLASGREIVLTDDRERMESILGRLEIATGSIPFELLSSAPGLRWYHHWYAGVDWLERYPGIRSSGLVVTNTSGVHAVPVTEQILAFMFAFARNFHLNFKAQLRHEWRKESMAQISELSGKRVLVIGTGAIGTHFARVAGCLGMHVTGIRRHPESGAEGLDSVFGPGELHRELGRADYIVVILPATPETRGMFAAREFSAMKNDAVFINAGRGSLVDEGALVKALREGDIGGAGLDVFEKEPLPADSPLWEMENVIIAPHTAGYTPEYVARSFEIFLDNVPRFLAGNPLRNQVDKAAGY